MRQETRRVWRERFGTEIIEGYGLTEAAPVVAVNTATHDRDGTVGRLLPGMRMRLEPVEGIGEGGRLWLQGPNLMMGYMTADRPGELQPLDGWHDTGDIVSVDREGFITIRGRAKRFAKIAGEMVSLGAVEMLVQALWPEEHHAVVAVPDKRRGERIVLVTTAAEADPETLRDFGKQAGVGRTDGAARHRQGRGNCRSSARARPTMSRPAAWPSTSSGWKPPEGEERSVLRLDLRRLGCAVRGRGFGCPRQPLLAFDLGPARIGAGAERQENEVAGRPKPSASATDRRSAAARRTPTPASPAADVRGGCCSFLPE